MPDDALVVSKLSVARGNRWVVRDLDMTARAGEVLAILGPNGAGKTTVLKAVAGLLPHDGEVLIHGRSRATYSQQALARALTFVPQQSLLRAALPAHQVVAQGRFAHRGSLFSLAPADREAINQAMATADVQHLAHRIFTRLSFGEQRRVLLARGLATGAQVLCLDEPTASLDIAHALALYRLVRRLADEGRCVILVLHQLDDALRHTDRAVLLSDGRCVSQGPTPDVVSPAHVESVYRVGMRRGGGLEFNLLEDT
ncbi:MAG: ABC transporter ATP-binding protein [Myxococcales bacterium]|nr:ABC transporter ATP-binding protein [Myxococcales bacterium]